jgi:hypothetical protein
MSTNGKFRYLVSGIAIGMFTAGLISALGLFPPFHDDNVLNNTVAIFAISGILFIVKVGLDYWWDV